MPLVPADSVIIEGVGALRAVSIRAARAPGPEHDLWWDMWAAQEDGHVARHGRVPVDIGVEW